MVRDNKRGIVQSVISGFLWASYSVTMYSLLNPFSGDTGTLDSAKGIMLIILAAVSIAWIDAIVAGAYELIYCYKIGKFSELKKELKSSSFFKIMPAAIFAGPLGLVPFAIASRYSVSVATSISAFYPALGSIVAMIWFKDKLSPMKFLGLLLAVAGVVVISGFSGLNIVGIILSIIASIGYSFELVFGYRLMADDVDPIVSLALKQVATVSVYTLIMVVLLLIPGNFGFFTNLVRSINFNSEFAFTAGLMNNKVLIILVFMLASLFNAAAYVFYFRGMNNAGVSTASSLNIAYGVWTIIILMVPPFLMMPTISSVIGSILTFCGSVLVIVASNKLESN